MTQIIASEEELKIGQVSTSLRDSQCVEHPEQTFVVLRKASAAEWEQEYLKLGGDPSLIQNVLGFFYLFYEVQAD